MRSVYQVEQIRELESRAIAQGVNDEAGLMALAGQAAVALIEQHWPTAESIVVCCGKGNNAGDGLVVARLLHEAGRQVTVHVLADLATFQGAAKEAADKAKAAGVNIHAFTSNTVFVADLVVDALLGTGLKGELTPIYIEAINTINESEAPVLALDVPSGLDANTGNILNVAVQATKTITFIGYKTGLFTHHASACCGEIIKDELDLPTKLLTEIKSNYELLAWEPLKPLLPKRKRDAHKGLYGHVLVIGGDYGMGGAVRMSAEAAMRSGAGLVSVATRPEHVPVVSGSRPEIMCHQVSTGEDLSSLLAVATVIVIGPGLGKSEWAQELLDAVLETDLPKILDADALNLLAQQPSQSDRWILTPHPGEAARLLGKTTPEVQLDRYATVAELQTNYQGVAVLKGSGSLIKGDGSTTYICPAGNPGMATGGMGDILSGVIGGLVAQGLSLVDAARLGVEVHATAADVAAEAGGERGLLATDLLLHIRQLVNPYNV